MQLVRRKNDTKTEISYLREIFQKMITWELENQFQNLLSICSCSSTADAAVAAAAAAAAAAALAATVTRTEGVPVRVIRTLCQLVGRFSVERAIILFDMFSGYLKKF